MGQPVIVVLMDCLPQHVLHVDGTVVLAFPAHRWTFVLNLLLGRRRNLTDSTHLSGMALQSGG